MCGVCMTFSLMRVFLKARVIVGWWVVGPAVECP